MGLGFRVGVPRLSVRVSTRGVRTSVGPRAARISVGSGGARISSRPLLCLQLAARRRQSPRDEYPPHGLAPQVRGAFADAARPGTSAGGASTARCPTGCSYCPIDRASPADDQRASAVLPNGAPARRAWASPAGPALGASRGSGIPSAPSGPFRPRRTQRGQVPCGSGGARLPVRRTGTSACRARIAVRRGGTLVAGTRGERRGDRLRGGEHRVLRQSGRWVRGRCRRLGAVGRHAPDGDFADLTPSSGPDRPATAPRAAHVSHPRPDSGAAGRGLARNADRFHLRRSGRRPDPLPDGHGRPRVRRPGLRLLQPALCRQRRGPPPGQA